MNFKILQNSSFRDCKAVIRKRFEGYVCLQVLISGELRLSVDGSARVIRGPYLWYTYPGPKFEYASTGREPWTHRYLAFSGDVVDSWVQNGWIFKGGLTIDRLLLEWLHRQLDKVLEESGLIQIHSEEASRNLVEHLVLMLSRARTVPAGGGGLRKAVVEYIEHCHFRPTGYRTLARQQGMGESTLRQKFRQEVGMPIHRFTEHQRIQKCKELLASADLTLEEIASSMGYPDVYYFSRHFRKIAGIPPGAFRKAYLRG